MSKLRQSKRKKQKKEKSKKRYASSSFQPAFNGYFKFFLGFDDMAEILEHVELTGDWKTKKGRILGKGKKDFKGRKFRVTLYLYNIKGQLGHEVVTMLDRASLELLVEAIKQQASMLAAESDYDIDLSKSYAVVKV